MVNETDKAIMAQFAARVREHYPTARIWLFGSRARGDATAESDFDVCVVVPISDTEARDRIREIAWEVSFEHNVVITTVRYSETEFTTGPRSATELVRNIREEGVAV